MAEKNTADIGFEKKIWDAACILRVNLDASEYKSVVLGLIFLKYISDRFEEKYNELVSEGDGFEEDIDEYTAKNIFFVPQDARWAVIAEGAHTAEIGTIIDAAMRSIEKENKRLKDILPKNFARPELDKRRLGDVVDLFTNIKMVEHGSSKDILGRAYEYCLSKFAEQEGKLAGEFYTPACVVKTLVEVLEPYNGRVYDPCCGSGGMFVQSTPSLDDLPFKGDTVVGNDVWIGQNVTVMPGIHIGDGAIIAANSVVTKDIPAYCIAGGNPCQVIKKRFDEELAEYLLQLQWWNWTDERVFENLDVLCSADLEKIRTIKR